MRVLITGGTGFLGRRLAARLLARGHLVGRDGKEEAIDELLLFDVAPPLVPLPLDKRLRLATGDIADRATVAALMSRDTRSIFHLAAVVSAEAEADTDKGMRVNLEGTLAVLEAARALGTCPRVVFASSLAVYGGDLPEAVGEDTPLNPQTSYGSEKACGELLVNDWSRKGLIDGRAPRLPTICIRTGRPNRAASTWASSILREPLAGVDAVCPVAEDAVMAVLSPRRAIAALERVHDLPGEAFGFNRAIQLPGISATVAEMVEALRRGGGEAAVRRIRWERDPAIERIVAGWPRAIRAPRAERLGFAADRDMDEIVAAFIADDLAAQRALVGTA